MSDELITREEILTGLPAGRASALFFLIESRTAYLMMQARQAMDVFLEGEQDYRATTGKVPTFPLLRYAIFQLPLGQAQELKVWAHRVTPEGDSEGLPGLLELRCGNKISQFDLKLSGGQVLLPLTSEACQLEIAFPGGG